MDNVQKEFVREHKNYIKKRGCMDFEQLKSFYPKNELIAHEMLFNECFYVLDDKNLNLSLAYIRIAYPETTVEDCMQLYEANKDFICEIYG